MSYFYTNVVPVGNNILYRCIKDGRRLTEKRYISPSLYVPTQKETQYKTIDGRPVEEIQFEDIKACKNFVEQYKDVDGFEMFGNTEFRAQFISSEFSSDIVYDKALIKGWNFDIETPSIDEDGKSLGFPDPEEAAFEVKSISLRDSITGTYFVFGLKDYVHNPDDPEVGHLDVKYMKCDSEADLLMKLVRFWSHDHPDYLTGWNIETFDIPYLVNRIRKILGEDWVKMLSPYKMVFERKAKTSFGKEQQIYQIEGISTLDYLLLYKKFTYTTRETYRLEHIATVELGEGKMDYSEAGTLNVLYIVDHDRFIRYNIKDVDLVQRLEDKLNLLDIVFTLAYFAKINFHDTLSPVKTWDNLIYHNLFAQNVVVPFKKKNEKPDQFAGAYVMVPHAGKYKWVLSADLNSLYPHLIQQYNLGPDTIIDPKYYTDAMRKIAGQVKPDFSTGKKNVDPQFLRKVFDTDALPENVCLTANGHFFKTDQMSFLSRIMRELYAGRKADKKLMLKKEQELVDLKEKQKKENFLNEVDFANQCAQLEKEIVQLDNMQMAKKIALNSGYGALGQVGFRYFDLRVAEAITLGGQLSIQWIMKKLDDYLNQSFGTTDEKYVIYGDTDSCYFTLDYLVQKAMPNETDETKIVDFLDTIFENRIQPMINKAYQELADYMKAYEQRMFMAREVIAPTAIWTAKKRYTMMVWDSEGVRFTEPKHKIMGMEAVKSSTPEICRGALKDAYKIALSGTNDELIDHIKDFKKYYLNLPLEDIAMPRSCNNLVKYSCPVNLYQKGAGKHVKGALAYNHLLKEKGLQNKYETIQDGDKVKFADLKKVNPTPVNAISFPTILPPEFGLDKYIDKEEMFKKAFISPLSMVTDAIGWETEKTVKLEDFFM